MGSICTRSLQFTPVQQQITSLIQSESKINTLITINEDSTSIFDILASESFETVPIDSYNRQLTFYLIVSRHVESESLITLQRY